MIKREIVGYVSRFCPNCRNDNRACSVKRNGARLEVSCMDCEAFIEFLDLLKPIYTSPIEADDARREHSVVEPPNPDPMPDALMHIHEVVLELRRELEGYQERETARENELRRIAAGKVPMPIIATGDAAAFLLSIIDRERAEVRKLQLELIAASNENGELKQKKTLQQLREELAAKEPANA